MGTIFDISNILGGIILAVGMLGSIGSGGIKGFVEMLSPFRWIFGAICLVLGVYFLLAHSGNAIVDIIGICAGLLLLISRLSFIPAIGGILKQAAVFLTPAEAIIGIAAIVVGVLGLL